MKEYFQNIKLAILYIKNNKKEFLKDFLDILFVMEGIAVAMLFIFYILTKDVNMVIFVFSYVQCICLPYSIVATLHIYYGFK